MIKTMTGRQIRSIRKRLGLTQGRLAMAVGVSFQSVNRWENGKNEPSAMAMRGILKLAAGGRPRTHGSKPFRHECECGRVIWFLPFTERPR